MGPLEVITFVTQVCCGLFHFILTSLRLCVFMDFFAMYIGAILSHIAELSWKLQCDAHVVQKETAHPVSVVSAV